MTRARAWLRTAAVLALCGSASAWAQGQAAGEPPTAAAVQAAIDQLASFDFPTRTGASRTVRRAATAIAVPALVRAAREHTDGYVRYRALVILAGFGDAAAGPTMRALLADRNDRLRTVAYGWFEHHPDPAMLPALLGAVAREGSEFVRPALTRAIAAHGDDPRVRETLLPLVLKGEDYFRSAVIEALGDYQARYAATVIADVAQMEGPLQDDAVIALGKVGDAASLKVLNGLRRSGPKDVQPAVAAAICLAGQPCGPHLEYLRQAVAFGTASPGAQPLLRHAAYALAAVAARGSVPALAALLESGAPAKDPARAPLALATGRVALRNSGALLEALEVSASLDAAIELIRDAFDMLAEDFEEERFFVDVRKAYWAAPASSARRKVALALIEKLEF